MGFEYPKGENDIRADKVMELIRSRKCKTVPEAVRQVLVDERITDSTDVKRIMSEIGSILKKRQQYVEENEIWEEIIDKEMYKGAVEAYWQRGGDPDDLLDEEAETDYRIGPRL